MPIYGKPSSDLVYDLINESNPGLPVAASAGTVNLNTPTAITPSGGKIQNTKMILNAPANSPFIGRREVTYRRIDLSNLFRSVIVQINKYSAAAAAGNQNTVAYTLYDLLADLNTKYGMSFTQDDLTNINITRGNTQNAQGYYYNTVTVTAKATSLAYVGSFTFRWVQAPQDIATLITQIELDGRMFPGGNDFSGAHKTILDSLGYSLDFTSQAAAASYAPTGGPGAATLPSTGSSAASNFLALGLALIDSTFGTSLNDNTWWRGATYYVYNITNAPFPPEGNTRYSNRLMVVTVPTADAAYVGKLYLHFNV